MATKGDDDRGILAILKAAFTDFGDDECSVRAAALSYYTVFALPPLLTLLIMIAGAMWDPQDVERALTGQFAGMMGPKAADAIRTMIASADRPDTGGALPLVLSAAGLLFGATGAFAQLQGAMNKAWEVKPDPDAGGIRQFVTKRLLSLGMVLGIGFLLAVSLALTTGVSALGAGMFGGIPEPVLHLLNAAVSLVVLVGLFAAMYKVLPDAEIAWRDVWVGAAVTAVLFVAGKFAIGFYLGSGDKGSAFGAAGALAVVLIWIYYAGMILLFGAEFTQKWAERRGQGIRPEKGAVRVVEEETLIRPGEAGSEQGKAGGGRHDAHRPARTAHRRPPTRPAHSAAAKGQRPANPGKGGFLLGLGLLLLRLRGRSRTRG